MKFVGGFFRFWYDFIVGDDWRVAVGVVLALALGASLVATESLSDAGVSLLVLAVIVFSLGISLRVQVRRRS